MEDIQGYLGDYSPPPSGGGWGGGGGGGGGGLLLAVTLCDIGWLNVSVECCVFCSSVFFCEKKNGSLWEKERSSVRERKVLRERKKGPLWEIEH